MTRPVLIYCFDAYCCWCYGFSPIIQKLAKEYAPVFDFEVLAGGMILPAKPVPIAVMARHFEETCQQVEKTTGVRFGRDFLWHVENPDDSDWFPNSEKPAVALNIIKDDCPHLMISFTASLQHALFYEGRDLCDDEAYRSLLPDLSIHPDEFYSKLHSTKYQTKAHEDFGSCHKLGVTGFPSLFLQTGEKKMYALSYGYTHYDAIKSGITEIISAIGLGN